MLTLGAQIWPFQVVPEGQGAQAFRDCWKTPTLQVHPTPLKKELVGQIGMAMGVETHLELSLLNWYPDLQTQLIEL